MKGEVPICSFSTNATLILYDLYSFCSFIHSQPLYFAYFVFFFPYLLRLLSFLSPLLFSTSLLLLGLFTITPQPNNLLIDISNSQCGFFLITFQTVLDALQTRLDGDLKPDHLIEPLASLVTALESCTEHAGQIHVVDRNRIDGAAANQAVGNESGRRTFGEELEWKISASDSLIGYEDEADTVEVSQEKESAEWENHPKADSVYQLPSFEVRDHVAEDHPKTRGKASQENDRLENESQEVMTLTHESPVFDLEISSNTSPGLIERVGGDIAEVALENDPEAHKSRKVNAFFSCGSFGPGLKTTTLGGVGEKHGRIVLGNDPEAYESPDATSSSSESYGFDLETESSVSQPLTYNMGGSPAQGGNDIGNLGSELETASMVSQELHEIPNIASLRVGRFGSGLKRAGSAHQPYAYKVGEKCIEDFNGSENASRGPSSPDSMWSSPGGFGSTRREKEWRRTLACKLYEERMMADSVDGMDSLWEAYDSDSGKMKATAKEKRGSKEKEKTKKSSLEQYKEEDDEDEEDDDDDEGMDEKLCCLQALRFSTAKMNLGMRRPSLVKISKAFKGMGMLVRGKGKSFR